MAEALPPEPVKFFVGVLAATRGYVDAARECLEAEWGAIDCRSEAQPWTYTDYYEKETGSEIFRAFFGFARLMDPGGLPTRKTRTNAMEREFALRLESRHPRPINLDPGYLAPDKLVLASCKNFSHRIYLADGIYAEITRLFRHGAFQSLPWTFPDYASGDYDPFFLELRAKLMAARET